jgi:hypothetical protein
MTAKPLPLRALLSPELRTVAHVAVEASARLTRRRIPHALTGALALAEYGYQPYTDEVALLLRAGRTDALNPRPGRPADFAPPLFECTTYERDGVKVHLLRPIGPVTRFLNSAVRLSEAPRRVSVLRVEALVAMKLLADTRQDDADVVNLLQRGTHPVTVRRYLAARCPKLVSRFEHLVRRARSRVRKGNEQEDGRRELTEQARPQRGTADQERERATRTDGEDLRTVTADLSAQEVDRKRNMLPATVTGDERLSIDGMAQPVRAWVEGAGITVQSFLQRVKRGWTLRAAATIPKNDDLGRYPVTMRGKTRSVGEWLRHRSVPEWLLRREIYKELRKGRELEQVITDVSNGRVRCDKAVRRAYWHTGDPAG